MIPDSRFNSFRSAFAFSKDLVSCDTRVLVSVSGGQDSMLLAWLLFQFQLESKLSPIWLYHNHMWHPEGFFHGVHCWRVSIVFDWPFLYTLPFRGIFDEEKSWAFRYHLRRRLCAFYNIADVFLGHTRTDRSESILFNFLRGSLFQSKHLFDVKTPILPTQRTYSLNVGPLTKIEILPSNIFSLNQSSLTFISPTFSAGASRAIKLKSF